MGSENPTWGEERIANELLLKLGTQVSPRTVRKYIHPRPPGQPSGDLRWSTFLRLHAESIIRELLQRTAHPIKSRSSTPASAALGLVDACSALSTLPAADVCS